MKKTFPSPLEAWVVSYKPYSELTETGKKFPSPLEAWVVSYRLDGYEVEKEKR